MKRIVIVVVVGLVVIAGALFLLSNKRTARIVELQKEAETKAAYKRADVYFKGSEEDKKYLDELFKYGAEMARQNLGGFFSPPPSEKTYYVTLYQAMVDEAKQKGKSEFARSFRGWVNGQGFGEVKF
jgi:hypothetical protein